MEEQTEKTSQAKNFTYRQFEELFPDDDACLEFIFRKKYTDALTCKKCNQQAHYHKVTGRKCYACEHCGHQVHPLAKTIFHKSATPLKDWFFIIFMIGKSKNGVAALEIVRYLGVTYKCAWRMAHKIRLLMEQKDHFFTGVVEVDETYVGGKAKGKRGRGAENKTPVVGVIERDGEVIAQVTPDTKAKTIVPIIQKHVKAGSRIITDEFASYNKLESLGYTHDTVNHAKKEYVRGDAHTNTMEGFWGQLKRSIDGTFHSVSKKHLQSYVNEFAFRHNWRKLDPSSVFFGMMTLAQQQF